MIDYTGIPLKMAGEDGNAVAIIARARKALRRFNRDDLVEPFTRQAMAGSYYDLLTLCERVFEVM
ncbi:MAG: hypothetical protein PHI85_03885 [Victivallaceae bacterium]|nr:hypothetical protein [Victivallaceae bacterium]